MNSLTYRHGFRNISLPLPSFTGIIDTKFKLISETISPLFGTKICWILIEELSLECENTEPNLRIRNDYIGNDDYTLMAPPQRTLTL